MPSELIPADEITETARKAYSNRNWPNARSNGWKKGRSGNPAGYTKAYRLARELARAAAPELIQHAIDLACDPKTDERVRSVCIFGLLDRAGIGPIDAQSANNELNQQTQPYNLLHLSSDAREELRQHLIRAQELANQALLRPTTTHARNDTTKS